MTAITVLDGSGGLHVSSGASREHLEEEEEDVGGGEQYGDDAVFVAPGDEIYVDMDAGFLKCVVHTCPEQTDVTPQLTACLTGCLSSEATARSWWATNCWPRCAGS